MLGLERCPICSGHLWHLFQRSFRDQRMDDPELTSKWEDSQHSHSLETKESQRKAGMDRDGEMSITGPKWCRKGRNEKRKPPDRGTGCSTEVQHPVRGLFLRYFLLQAVKDTFQHCQPFLKHEATCWWPVLWEPPLAPPSQSFLPCLRGSPTVFFWSILAYVSIGISSYPGYDLLKAV